MIIVKLKGNYTQETVSRLEKKFSDFFYNEKVLVINAELIEIEFLDYGKKRCSYCGMLNDNKLTICDACGGVL